MDRIFFLLGYIPTDHLAAALRVGSCGGRPLPFARIGFETGAGAAVNLDIDFNLDRSLLLIR